MHRGIPNHTEYEMKPVRRADPGASGKRAGSTLGITALAMAAMLGCMAPDPAEPGPAEDTSVPDRNQLAGATSSTNWPPEDAGSKTIGAKVKVDSQFRISFFDTSGGSLPLSGTVTVFAGNGIPVFHAPDSSRFRFTQSSSLSIPDSILPGKAGSASDSLVFSVRVDTDSLHTLITGYLFSKRERKFVDFKDPRFSRTFRMSTHGYAFRVESSGGLPLSRLPDPAGKKWCFYIPATPYYFLSDSAGIIELGPLPDGSYPLRLLQIGEPDGPGGARTLRVFEIIQGTPSTNAQSKNSLELGQKIDEFVTISSISIRS